jgi:hypothetical protein
VSDGNAGLRDALARWRRRVRGALLLGGFTDGLAATALVGAAAILVLRLFGVEAPPHPAWGLALAVPAGTAVLRLVRRDPTVAEAALHLDRRLGLEGLLLVGLDRDVSAWRARLDEALARVGEALPRVRFGRAAARAAIPLAALGGVLLLPPPEAAAAGQQPALVRAIDDLERRFRAIAENEGLREEDRRETEERIRSIEERLDDGKAVSWADVDAAAERLDREARLRSADLAKTKAAADAFARVEHADAGAARAEWAALAEAAADLGLLDDLPAGAAEKAAALAAGTSSPGAALDAAALEALAKALSETAGSRLSALEALGVVDAAALAALERLLANDPRLGRCEEGGCCASCRGDRPEGCDG